jgi:2Fe-2S ferredoxin
MPQLIITDTKGKTTTLDADTGISAMIAIRDAGIDGLLALCGGMCSCATCHVHVDPSCMSMLGEMSADEDELLAGSIRRNEYSRLSCQILLTDALDGLRLTVAAED